MRHNFSDAFQFKHISGINLFTETTVGYICNNFFSEIIIFRDPISSLLMLLQLWQFCTSNDRWLRLKTRRHKHSPQYHNNFFLRMLFSESLNSCLILWQLFYLLWYIYSLCFLNIFCSVESFIRNSLCLYTCVLSTRTTFSSSLSSSERAEEASWIWSPTVFPRESHRLEKISWKRGNKKLLPLAGSLFCFPTPPSVAVVKELSVGGKFLNHPGFDPTNFFLFIQATAGTGILLLILRQTTAFLAKTMNVFDSHDVLTPASTFTYTCAKYEWYWAYIFILLLLLLLLLLLYTH